MGYRLSIARTIVEAHGGHLSVENKTGGGAVFHIRIRLASAPEMTGLTNLQPRGPTVLGDVLQQILQK